MLELEEKERFLRPFETSSHIKNSFIQGQRLIWEKSIFPHRFPPCSSFLCSTCHSKPSKLSICISCGSIFCMEHFGQHPCKNPFGIDIQTQQLFFLNQERRRTFVFDPLIDRLIISAKLAVVDGIPFSADHDPPTPILPNHRSPIPLHNLGNTCWLNSIFQCFMANPLIEKWFLSGKYTFDVIDSPIAAVHVMMTRMFLAVNGKGTFSLSDFLFCLKALYPDINLSEQRDSQEFFMRIRSSLDDFYQTKFESKDFGYIFNWTFNIIESCEYCSHTQIHPSPESILNLTIASSNTLKEAMDQFFNGESPMTCLQCQHSAKKQYYFHTLPQTLSIALVQSSSDNKRVANIKIDEVLDLGEFGDPDIKKFESSTKYSLFSAVIRPKTGDNGHFWACVKRNGKWFSCNDNIVKPIEVQEVLREDVILLFYLKNGFISRK